jgi:hypothetical protein
MRHIAALVDDKCASSANGSERQTKKALLSQPIRDSVEVRYNYCESDDGGKRNLYGLAEGYLRAAC